MSPQTARVELGLAGKLPTHQDVANFALGSKARRKIPGREHRPAQGPIPEWPAIWKLMAPAI